MQRARSGSAIPVGCTGQSGFPPLLSRCTSRGSGAAADHLRHHGAPLHGQGVVPRFGIGLRSVGRERGTGQSNCWRIRWLCYAANRQREFPRCPRSGPGRGASRQHEVAAAVLSDDRERRVRRVSSTRMSATAVVTARSVKQPPGARAIAMPPAQALTPRQWTPCPAEWPLRPVASARPRRSPEPAVPGR